MKITTNRALIRSVAMRWRATYGPFIDENPSFSFRFGENVISFKNKEDIANSLDALDGETATNEDVASIIGNDSWTKLICNECGKNVDAVICIGEPPDWESRTAFICKKCIKKAASLFSKHTT